MKRTLHIPPSFTYIPNEVIKKITNLDALGIYTYICSIKPGCEISIEGLKNRFSCDREHILKSVEYLKKLGVLENDFEGEIE